MAVVTGVLALGAAFGIRSAYLGSIESQQLEQFTATADYVARSLQSSLDAIENQAGSVTGLVLASEDVRADELSRFVAMSERPPGVVGWGIVEVDGDAMPVTAFHPTATGGVVDWSGRDLGEHRTIRTVVAAATSTGEPMMSRFLRLESGTRGAVLVVPAPLEWGRAVAGIALIDIDQFQTIASRSAGDIATVVLSESTGTPTSDSLGPERAVGLADRNWSVAIQPRVEMGAPSSLSSAVVTAVVAGMIAALAGALVKRRELQASLERTGALNEARDEFLGVISHEIRTPLTAVVGFAGELRRSWELLAPEERNDMLRLIDEQGQEVAAIVSDLLVAGRADVHSLHIGLGPVEVAQVVRLAVDGVPGGARDGLRVGDCEGMVYADRGRLTQVLRNLVVNAIRYGGPEVTVESRLRDGRIDIVVSDNGDGVPAEFTAAVFDRYFAITRESAALPSMGLGLYVSRRLTEVMGGSLTYRREHGWSRFVASMPAAVGGPGVALPEAAGQPAGSQTA